MKKVIDFCQLHRATMLFAMAVLLCMFLSVCSVMVWQGTVGAITIAAAPVLLAVLGYYIQKLEKTASEPSREFTFAWYTGFILQALTLAVCSLTVQPAWLLIAHFPLIISFDGFVALLGYLVLLAHQPENKKYRRKPNTVFSPYDNV
ncbi:MAG: hypothetical protein J6Y91_00135 [Alphaproteobacteria bacterium]|nr:hypothetical protein [Alphaproteobacteria bacterium]